MNKREFIKIIANKTGMTVRKTESFYDTIFDTMKEVLKKNSRVSVANFGTFSIFKKNERRGKNPQTGDDIVIPASNKIKFSISSIFKEELN